MKLKELDCVKLKDGREGCIMMELSEGHFLLELDGHPDIEDNIVITADDVEKITYEA
mgnify:CR=1 FL=1